MNKKGSVLTKVLLVIILFVVAGFGVSEDFSNKDIAISGDMEISLNTQEDINHKTERENDATTDAYVTEKTELPETGVVEEYENATQKENGEKTLSEKDFLKNFSLENVPEYTNEPYAIINNNIPYFTNEEMTTNSYESFSELDELERCGVVHASVGQDLMPTEEREYIGYIKPTGWQVSKYDWIDGAYLYNRCHLIGFQLTGENANERNLITGTRYMNVQGMLPFENEIADYVEKTDNHVMYRVTPIFEDDNLVASGVLMEAKSVEDSGVGVMFNVYCYNVQPGIEIDYATGANYKVELPQSDLDEQAEKTEYVLNKNSKKFHLPSCDGVKQMSEKNKQSYIGYKSELISMGYEPCQSCNP